MPQIIDINEIPSPPGKRYAIAKLDEAFENYGKAVTIGLWPILTLDTNLYTLSLAEMSSCHILELDLTRAKATVADLFAEEVRTFPLKRPSGKTEPTSVLNMVEIQVRSIIKRDRWPDDDGEWALVSSQIVRSMTPAQHKIMIDEFKLLYDNNLGNCPFPTEDEEALFEIAGLEPNQWTGKFVEDLLPLKSKWSRW